MKKTIVISLFLSVLMVTARGQKHQKNAMNEIARPKLVVGIVVDQMRWDYLYRYYDRYSEGGFRRLLREGFSFENAMINYIPSYTAVGHSTIYTGSVPSIDGIAGNTWYDFRSERQVYCTDDSTVRGVGATKEAGKMSPRNLLVTTITDELRLSTNFRSKVVGISLKDRASILPAGHNPTAAFWLDDASGKFITSTYYMKELPGWVNNFNSSQPVEKLLAGGWNTLLPPDQYNQSSSDNEPWEGILPGALQPVFPYDVQKAYQLNHYTFRLTPFGNTLTLRFAEAAINGYQLGQETSTDFLTINCASTDYAGHLTGVNSVEIEDVYLRLDRDLASFFTFLDNNIGKGNYLVFLTADHGAAHAEGFMKDHKLPTGILSPMVYKNLENDLDRRFASTHLLLGIDNFQVTFNRNRIDSLKLDMKNIKDAAMDYLENIGGILYVVDQDRIAEASVPEPLKEMMINGYNRNRSGSILLVPMPGWLPDESVKGTTHGVWNPYDTHIPLVFMGWKIPQGSTYREVYMTDIAPTLAALLRIQMPNGCIGKPMEEVINKSSK
jgi:predicted AlkP superfamily pyrophosphatase or phosphodiesterase